MDNSSNKIEKKTWSLKQTISLITKRRQFSHCSFIHSPNFSTSVNSTCAANSTNICRFVRFRKYTWLAVFFACRNHWGVLVNTTKTSCAQVHIKNSRMQATIYHVSAAGVKARNVTSLNCMQKEIPMAISTHTVRRIFWELRLVIYGLKVSLYCVFYITNEMQLIQCSLYKFHYYYYHQRSTCFGWFSAHHRELIKLYVQPWVLSCFPAVYRWCGWFGTTQTHQRFTVEPGTGCTVNLTPA